MTTGRINQVAALRGVIQAGLPRVETRGAPTVQQHPSGPPVRAEEFFAGYSIARTDHRVGLALIV